jgi:hypothetical protein
MDLFYFVVRMDYLGVSVVPSDRAQVLILLVR